MEANEKQFVFIISLSAVLIIFLFFYSVITPRFTGNVASDNETLNNLTEKNLSGIDFNSEGVFAIPISNNVIKLNLTGKYMLFDIMNYTNYRLFSVDDPIFITGEKPVNIGKIYGINSIKVDEIFLIFSKSMQNGKSYTLNLYNIVNSSSQIGISIDYDDNDVSETIRVNRNGYYTGSAKYAYIGSYLGDAGYLSISSPICEVKSSIGITILSVKSERKSFIDSLLKNNYYYACDFSSIINSGVYYIYVKNIGRTYYFKIDNNLSNSSFKYKSDPCFGTLYGIYANKYGCPVPVTEKFQLSNIDFEDSDLSSLKDFEIGNEYGKISYTNTSLTLYNENSKGFATPIDIDNNLLITKNYTYLDIKNLPNLNFPAILTFYNVSNSKEVLLNYKNCKECNIISFENKTLAYYITNFEFNNSENNQSNGR